MNARELNQRLLDKIESVCSHLIPDGKKKGREWVAGSIHGGNGESFGVRLTGERAGYFQDMNPADDVRGRSLVTLWGKAKGITDWKELKKDICEWLQIPVEEDHNISKVQPKNFVRPDTKKMSRIKEGGKVHQYLTLDRDLSESTIEKSKISESKDGEWICFNHFEGDKAEKESLSYVNRLSLQRDSEGKKEMRAVPNGKMTLFGKHTVPADADYVIICEGQIDQMSWMQMGFNCVSLPSGVPNMGWVENDWEWLDRFTEIYIAMDNDSAGNSTVEKLAHRLGMERCWRIKYLKDFKDANDMLVAACEKYDFQEILDNAEEIKPCEVQRALGFEKETWDLLYGADAEEPGVPYPLPFPSKIPDNYGSIVLFTGYKKHGKTAFVWQNVAWLLANGKRGMVGSFEVPAKQACQHIFLAGCAGKPVENDFKSTYEAYMSDLFIYNKVGKVHWRDLIESMRFAYRRYGLHFFVIDSLMRVGVQSKDAEEVDKFMNALADFVNETGTTVFLVAHARKNESRLGGEKMVPTSDMVRGAGEIGDNVWCQFAVWRNFEKEEKRNKGGKDCSHVDEPDAKIQLQFQRYFDGRIKYMDLNFCPRAKQYYEKGSAPKPYFSIKKGA